MSIHTDFDVRKCKEYPKTLEKVLKALYKSGIIGIDEPILSDMDKYMAKIKTNIVNCIRQNHPYAVCRRSDGRYQTKLPDKKILTGRTVEELYMKLFMFYNGSHTFETLYPQWVENKSKRCSDASVSIYRQKWEKYLKGSALAKIEVENFKVKDWIKFSRDIVGNGNMKIQCYKDIKTVVNGILDDAVLDDIIPTNPIRGLYSSRLGLMFAPDEKDRTDDFYTEEECRLLLEYLSGYVSSYHRNNHYALGGIIQIYTGVRIGELKSIHIGDINFKDRTVYIHSSVVLREDSEGVRRKQELKHTKGKDSEANRVIPLTDKAMEAVESLIAFDERLFGKGYVQNGSNHLLATEIGTIISTNRYNKHFSRFCKEAGIGHHTSHDNRRFAISVLFERGLPEFAVQKFAGHLCPSTTHRYYRKVACKQNEDLVRDALQAI